MKKNLQNLRKIFIGQVQSGITTQQKYLNMSRS